MKKNQAREAKAVCGEYIVLSSTRLHGTSQRERVRAASETGTCLNVQRRRQPQPPRQFKSDYPTNDEIRGLTVDFLMCESRAR